MSVYSQYGMGTSSASSNIIADESYSGFEGAFRMIEESVQNEHAIFEAIIKQDFAEAYNRINPAIVSESQLVAIQEANGTGVWGKILDFIESIGAKIMGIIKTLMDKIQSVFIRDGKELVKKFEKQINAKMAQGKYTKMKFKYSKPKNEGISNDTLESKLTGVLKTTLEDCSNLFSKAVEVKKLNDDSLKHTGSMAKFGSAEYNHTGTTTKIKPFTEDDKIDMLEKALGGLAGTGSSTIKEFNKDFDAYVFNDIEEIEGYSSALNTTIKENLTETKKNLDTLSKNKRSTESFIASLRKQTKDIQKKATDAMGKDKAYTNDVYKGNAVAGRVNTCLSIYSKVSANYYGALGSAIKKDLKQCRSIYVKAATYNQKQSVEDQAILMTAVRESSDYEVDEMFDSMVLV